MVRGEIVEGCNRDARKGRRQELGKLKDLAVKPQTRRRYEHAMRLFFEFLRWNKIVLPSLPDKVDRVACSYIEEMGRGGFTLPSERHTFCPATF